MINRAKRTILPSLSLSLASSDSENNSKEVKLVGANETITYYRTPVRTSNGKRIDGGPPWSFGQYSRFPIVLNNDGSPWKEANLYLIDLAEINSQPNMLSLGVVAEDLAALEIDNTLNEPINRLSKTKDEKTILQKRLDESLEREIVLIKQVFDLQKELEQLKNGSVLAFKKRK